MIFLILNSVEEYIYIYIYIYYTYNIVKVKVKLKQSHYRPGQALGFPGV